MTGARNLAVALVASTSIALPVAVVGATCAVVGFALNEGLPTAVATWLPSRGAR